MICRHLNAGTNVAHTCSGKGSCAANSSGPCNAGSLDVGYAEFRRELAFNLSAGDYECVKESNGVTTALRSVFFCEHGACSLEIWMTRLKSGSAVAVHAVFLQNLQIEASSQAPLKMMARSGIFCRSLEDQIMSLGLCLRTTQKYWKKRRSSCRMATWFDSRRLETSGNLYGRQLCALVSHAPWVHPNGKVKLRVILICRQCAVSAVSSNAVRVLLLRLLDVMLESWQLVSSDLRQTLSML